VLRMRLPSTCCAPSSWRAPSGTDRGGRRGRTDSLLQRLPGETPFNRYRIIERIGDLGTRTPCAARRSSGTRAALDGGAAAGPTQVGRVPVLLGAAPRTPKRCGASPPTPRRGPRRGCGAGARAAAREPGRGDPAARRAALGMRSATRPPPTLIRSLQDDDPVVRGRRDRPGRSATRARRVPSRRAAPGGRLGPEHGASLQPREPGGGRHPDRQAAGPEPEQPALCAVRAQQDFRPRVCGR
jgi:hypothetical protein